jgi:hypothetical protein
MTKNNSKPKIKCHTKLEKMLSSLSPLIGASEFAGSNSGAAERLPLFYF